MDTKKIDDIAERIAQMMPSAVTNLQQELKADIKAALQSAFAKLDLVGREEFDVQSQVLAHTRKKLIDLEKKIQELETPLEHAEPTARIFSGRRASVSSDESVQPVREEAEHEAQRTRKADREGHKK